MINDFIKFKESSELVTKNEKLEISEILVEYTKKGFSKEFNFNYNLLPKKMDECRRVFSVERKDKVILQYINYIIKTSCNPSIVIMSCNNIIKQIQDNSAKYKYLKITDLSKYFDRIDRNILLEIINRRIENKEICKNIQNALINVFKAMDESNKKIIENEFSNKENIKNSGIEIGKGIPQGIPISNILAILYLEDLEKEYKEIYRYIDDIFILSKNKSFNNITKKLKEKKLIINKKKTKCIKLETGEIYDIKGNIQENMESINILGYSTLIKNKKFTTSPSFKSFNRQFRLLNEIKKEYELSPSRKKYLEYKLNLQICGHYTNTKQMGWVFYYQSINEISKLKLLDNWVKINLPDFENPKKYIRTYHCIRNLNDADEKNAKKNLRYIKKNITIDCVDSKMKKEILSSYYGSELTINENQVEERFKKIYFNNLNRLEEDFGRKSWVITNEI